MLRTALVTGLILAASATLPALAQNNDADVEACRAAVEAEAGNGVVKFKGAGGASVRKLRFAVTTDGSTKSVTCKVKRGEVITLEWK